MLVGLLKMLSKSDPLLVCTTDERGEHVMLGGGGHVDICLQDFRDSRPGDVIPRDCCWHF